MAASNINRVVLTGNLTRDPGASLPAVRHVGLQPAHRVQLAAQGKRRVGRQAQLLQRHRLGRPGRELRPLPVQGPPGLHRRPPRLARVAGPGRPEARVRRDRRRGRPVPGQPRRNGGGGGDGGGQGGTTTASRRTPTFPRIRRTSPRSPSALARRPRTTTSRSRPARERSARRAAVGRPFAVQGSGGRPRVGGEALRPVGRRGEAHGRRVGAARRVARRVASLPRGRASGRAGAARRCAAVEARPRGW